MSSLFIDRRNIQLECAEGALVVRDRGERIATIPLAPITRVFLRGSATLQASVLGALGERGIGVVILSGRKATPTLFFGRPHNDARLRVEQTRRSLQPDFCLDYARQLVQGKLKRQQEQLEGLRRRHPDASYPLRRAIDAIERNRQQAAQAARIDSLRGVEGSAASSYFGALPHVTPPSIGFKGRNRRPPRDPLNALLSLTYTLLLAEAAFALHAAGLDPCIGYYHQLSYSRESLACDVMEPVRPLADQICIAMLATQTLTAEHFSATNAGCLLGKAGRSRYYAAYEEHAPALRAAVQAEVKALMAQIAPDLPPPDLFTPTWDDEPDSTAPAGGSFMQTHALAP